MGVITSPPCDDVTETLYRTLLGPIWPPVFAICHGVRWLWVCGAGWKGSVTRDDKGVEGWVDREADGDALRGGA